MIKQAQHRMETSGERLDRFLLHRYPWLDRPTIHQLIAAGHIRLEGPHARRAAKGTRLAAGDTLTLRDIPEPEDLQPRANPDLPLAVAYEDEVLLAFSKPAGQPTHPLRHDETGTLVNAMLARYPQLAAIGESPLFPALLHRLDTQTSGLVLAAKTPGAYAALRGQFRRFLVEKHYTALVHGRVDTPGRLEAPLMHQTRTPCKMAVVRSSAAVAASEQFAAATAWKPLQTGVAQTLLDVTIFTGVTHQIRAHLAHIGHPIVGDALYGSPAANAPRHWLHASRVHLCHPAHGKSMILQAPLPDDWPPCP
ncbi:MAG: RluA family pseudouridine synthase [Verrucomicrobiota bacterium]|jgi:23S rRNA pseudouridine1911/1915/1917 synthase|nr:RluA family pseudouridine synthase [Verrucomicrobiota bacterium]